MVGKSGQPFKKSRKYGESAEDLQDRLDFVAALLALADEEIAIPPDSLKAQFKLEWVKADELRVSGIIEQKQRNGQIKRIEKGITKKDLGVLLETYRRKPILEAAKDELIQNALACLRDLEIIKEHESAKNQGYWKFSLFLKCKATREENLQVIRDKWKESFGNLPEIHHPPQLTATLNRCILGLKGDYQKAQQQLTEITTTLQNRLKDKTLSITKVEEGSIILIVESSQTGYEQLKRLIGQEIAGFPVEYAIDEWQDICRRMLIDRKPLTSNTVLGQAYGNRNLIDEDLFVDLALVKPKRSQNEKYGQDIDPARGSDLFARQEETVEKRFAYREFLDEIIGDRTEKNIAIIGEPGAGKTTLLQKLAFWLLQQTDDLVIWVDLAELGSQTLGEYLEEKWLKEALGKSREEIKADWKQKFKGGAVWLLLDGLDEMSQTDQQALKFRGWVTYAQMIVTCRLNLWQAKPTQLQGFQTYLTQPFQDEQMQEFIRRWFRGMFEEGKDVQLAESLWSELQAAGKERIKDLCRNPLRLTLLCSTWKVDEALSETTAELLYESFVESMYECKETSFAVREEENEVIGKFKYHQSPKVPHISHQSIFLDQSNINNEISNSIIFADGNHESLQLEKNNFFYKKQICLSLKLCFLLSKNRVIFLIQDFFENHILRESILKYKNLFFDGSMLFVSKEGVNFNNFFDYRIRHYKNFSKSLLRTYKNDELNRIIHDFPEPFGLRMTSMTPRIEYRLRNDLENNVSTDPETLLNKIQFMEKIGTIKDSWNSISSWLTYFLDVNAKEGEPILFDNLLSSKRASNDPSLQKMVRQRLFDIYFAEVERAYNSFSTSVFKFQYPYIWKSSSNSYYNLKLFIRILSILGILEKIQLLTEEELWNLKYNSHYQIFRDWYEQLCLSTKPTSWQSIITYIAQVKFGNADNKFMYGIIKELDILINQKINSIQ